MLLFYLLSSLLAKFGLAAGISPDLVPEKAKGDDFDI